MVSGVANQREAPSKDLGLLEEDESAPNPQHVEEEGLLREVGLSDSEPSHSGELSDIFGLEPGHPEISGERSEIGSGDIEADQNGNPVDMFADVLGVETVGEQTEGVDDVVHDRLPPSMSEERVESRMGGEPITPGAVEAREENKPFVVKGDSVIKDLDPLLRSAESSADAVDRLCDCIQELGAQLEPCEFVGLLHGVKESIEQIESKELRERAEQRIQSTEEFYGLYVGENCVMTDKKIVVTAQTKEGVEGALKNLTTHPRFGAKAAGLIKKGSYQVVPQAQAQAQQQKGRALGKQLGRMLLQAVFRIGSKQVENKVKVGQQEEALASKTPGSTVGLVKRVTELKKKSLSPKTVLEGRRKEKSLLAEKREERDEFEAALLEKQKDSIRQKGEWAREEKDWSEDIHEQVEDQEKSSQEASD
jgi:hypothetical protein